MKRKEELKMYNKLIGKKEEKFGNNIKAYQTSVKFASSFILVLFGSAFMGYYLGQQIFGLKYEFCLALSGICIFLTLILEAFLFIIKE